MQKILIVEDDFNFQTTLAEYFMKRRRKQVPTDLQTEFQIDLATSYNDALYKYVLSEQSSKSYDLVIIDYQLEGKKNGLSLHAEFLKINHTIPIIMLSGISIEQFIQITKNKKCVPKFLTKPFNLKELEQIWSDIKSNKIAA